MQRLHAHASLASTCKQARAGTSSCLASIGEPSDVHFLIATILAVLLYFLVKMCLPCILGLYEAQSAAKSFLGHREDKRNTGTVNKHVAVALSQELSSHCLSRYSRDRQARL